MTMKVIDSISGMRAWSLETRQVGYSIGLVPTMGYLHEGHLSLIREARKQSDRVVVSIFVNPTQFAPGEDLERYPRDFERDHLHCEQEGTACIFYPSVEEMYPAEHKTFVKVEELSERLCGISRPVHFRGVTTIVLKLFNIVRPDVAVFGQKDAQQSIIIRRMTEDLNMDVGIITAPTIREADGLAMSSRNKYLTPRERQEAPVLYKSLRMARSAFENGNRDFDDIRSKMEAMITSESSGRIDYIEIVNTVDLTPSFSEKGDILIALAVHFGKARLIDNCILKRNQEPIGSQDR